MMFDAIPTMADAAQAGKVRPLGVSGTVRSKILPDVPTIAEAGVPGYESTIWLGLMAPKGTPKDVIDKLNAAMQAMMKQAAIQEAWAKQGAVPMLMSPAEFDAMLRKDIEKWAAVVKTANIKPQ
jgi:tripartite-type tricarboxylate transporter receptor subunit TctC